LTRREGEYKAAPNRLAAYDYATNGHSTSQSRANGDGKFPTTPFLFHDAYRPIGQQDEALFTVNKRNNGSLFLRIRSLV